MGDAPAIWAEGLKKSFGRVTALDGVDLSVAPGTVLGLLGVNGAGKTTAVRVLTTLLVPDAGRARVAGYDVVGEAEQLRSAIGLAGQYAAVDENLTGRENLVLVGRLYHLDKREAVARADALLERFGLSAVADRRVSTYSGGTRRRLDLGASLVGRPRVLFLDEPTSGLDPRSRFGMWETIGELVDEGTTLLLTTQYLEEADRLAHRIAVIDEGRVVAEGTAKELKSRIGGEVLVVTVTSPAEVVAAAAALSPLGGGEPQVDRASRVVTVPVPAGARVLADAVRLLDGGGVVIDDLALRGPTLDEVFVALTGQAASAPPDNNESGRRPPRGRRSGRSGHAGAAAP